MRFKTFYRKALPIVGAAIACSACSAPPQVSRTPTLAEPTDAPYKKVLVIFLASSFDARRYLETEVAKRISERGAQAVASTSMMDSKTPATRKTFLAMVEATGADAVLVTQLVNLDIEAKKKDRRPQATYNFRPTYYYNVWSVELQEYVEPQATNYEFSLVLATQVYSALTKDVVWAIESKSKFSRDFDHLRDYSTYEDEAAAIVRRMSKDKLIAR